MTPKLNDFNGYEFLVGAPVERDLGDSKPLSSQLQPTQINKLRCTLLLHVSAESKCRAMTMMTMKAAVIHEPGAPEVLAIEELPVPHPAPGWFLIRVKAFGLNSLELFTRQGHSPGVRFPRVLGIEAVGTVEKGTGAASSNGGKP